MLACPACPRTLFKGQYSVTDLSLAAIRSLVESSPKVSFVILCGDHGDPIYHPEFHEVLELLQKLPGHPPFWIATNGSYRNESWWRRTAQLLREKDTVVFGLDGLADTSMLYRKNSDWHSATEGLRFLKRYGICKVNWQWILFRFNEHQLSEARKLCEAWGVDEFSIVRSFRNPATDLTTPTITTDEAYERFRN
jgi:MoaA/NifB/PqqE/SkfB family radical SAM enzyme